MAVGEPVVATDLNNETLTYVIQSQTGGPFTVDSGTGQIRLGASVILDYEARRITREVTLTATDPDGLTDTIEVAIEIADVNEPAVGDGVSNSEDTTFPENSESTVGRFRATDPEAGLLWMVGGPNGRRQVLLHRRRRLPGLH